MPSIANTFGLSHLQGKASETPLLHGPDPLGLRICVEISVKDIGLSPVPRVLLDCVGFVVSDPHWRLQLICC